MLDRREELQSALDGWHRRYRGDDFDETSYRAFLEELGYLEPEGEDFSINTENVDDEIARLPGPQLVVPVTNARYALNAANARWGSLYDAVYGTDALGDLPPDGSYDPARGERVIAWVRALLDDVTPLASGSHADTEAYAVVDGQLTVTLHGGDTVGLADLQQLAGFTGAPAAPSSVLLRVHGLHIEIVIDRNHQVGAADAAGVADVVLEAALTSIADCEDSVATVDAEDKVLAYHNWLGLNRGDLTAEVTKDGRTFTRRLEADRTFGTPDGGSLTLPGRALMLVRNVGLLTPTDAVLDRDGNESPEGLLDAMVTVLCAMHDLAKSEGPRSSRTGSIYVVKPKLHGPAEVAFTNDVFTHVEAALGLPFNTVDLAVVEAGAWVDDRSGVDDVLDRGGRLLRVAEHQRVPLGQRHPRVVCSSSTSIYVFTYNSAQEADSGVINIAAGVHASQKLNKEVFAIKAAARSSGRPCPPPPE